MSETVISLLQIIAAMVLNIICFSVFWIVLLSLSSIGLAIVSNERCYSMLDMYPYSNTHCYDLTGVSRLKIYSHKSSSVYFVTCAKMRTKPAKKVTISKSTNKK